MTYHLSCYQVADSIDIKSFKTAFNAELIYADEAELFYKTTEDDFVYVFKYGVVCFANCDQKAIDDFLHLIEPFCKNPFSDPFEDKYQVETNASERKIGFHKALVRTDDITAVRLVMLNVSQSVSLDYYSDQMSTLLEVTNKHTQALVSKGQLQISGNRLRKHIGQSLLLKNRIAENLYIFDSPEETWENEELDKLDSDLKRTFDLQPRVRNIHEGLGIIKDNLEFFQAMMQYRNSTILEWIIIILIAIEVVPVIFGKLF